MKIHITFIALIMIISALLSGQRAKYSEAIYSSIYEICEKPIANNFLFAYSLKKSNPQKSFAIFLHLKNQVNISNKICSLKINQELEILFSK